MSELVRPLSECSTDGADVIGGKALGLARLMERGYSVPPGFVVTSAAYRHCVAGVETAIGAALASADDAKTTAAAIAPLFDNLLLATDLKTQIGDEYHRLGADVAVAVRSSATAEDSDTASFAGQQDTYLWVVGDESVIEHVVRCWASLYTARAIGYRERAVGRFEREAMAVVVQRMVPAEAAGVMMTLNPISGDRSVIYIESSFGLGESVVRGEVSPDRYTVVKDGYALQEREIAVKSVEYRRGAESGEIDRIEIEPDRQQLESLSEAEVTELAVLGVRVESDFGSPMDIEWAVEQDPSGHRQIMLVQARPETVWAQRSEVQTPLLAVAAPNLLNSDGGVAGTYWTTANVGEAMPGVQTPLSWTVWKGKTDHGMREAGYALGVLTRSERRSTHHPIVDVFYGRAAIKVNFFALFGDRSPGTSTQDLFMTYLGSVPEDLELSPTVRRYPVMALRTPWSFARIEGKLKRFVAQQNQWWTECIADVERLELSAARRLLAHAVARHDASVVMQSVGTLVGVQPIYDAVTKLARRAGVDPSELTAVPGAPEMDVIADIWRASRGELTVAEVVARHGFHGPNEGELSARVWREDTAPLQNMITQYAGRADTDDPIARDRGRHAARAELERDLLRSLSRIQRPAAQAILAFARRRIPLRGLAKRSMLQSFDVARASARRIGQLLEQGGVLAEAEDVFFLTVEELLDPSTRIDRGVVEDRRKLRVAYQEVAIPNSWTATPVPFRLKDSASSDHLDGDTVRGVGVSAGVVTGLARVVAETDFAAVERGEILVAPHTDPSWSSVMFLSAGLVVDIGGALSHAAVVARELRLPCVINTIDGTRRIGTGDRIRVDGGSGTVTVVERASGNNNETMTR